MTFVEFEVGAGCGAAQRDDVAIARVSSSGGCAGRCEAGWDAQGAGCGGQAGMSGGSTLGRTLARHNSLLLHDRTTDARARCRITALNLSRERDRQFGNGRAPCFELVIDSAE